MKSTATINKLWQKVLYRAACLLFVSALAVSSQAVPLLHASSVGNRPAWANPSAMAVKRVSGVPAAQHQPNLLSNLDCMALTYRLVGNSTMRTGCFTPAAFGLLDSDSETVIYNGTDEGLPLLPYSPQEVLVPWPDALNLITLDAANTGGSYIGMYKNPMSVMQDERDWKGQLVAKRLTAPPDIPLRDSAGKPLIINPQTMASSDGGSWLVVETLSGSFIRLNLASLDQTPFAPAFGAQGSPGALLKSQVAVSDDGRYVAIGNDAAGSLRVYDLTACGNAVCAAHDYRSFAGQQIGGLQKIRHIRFINDGLLSFEAVTNSSNDGIYELAPTGSITSLTDYLGLGDSYTSGEGAFDYLSGTDTDDNTCHLSANSYPLLLTRDLFNQTGGHSVACSGAVTNDIGAGSGSYRGQVKDGHSLDELRISQSALLDSVMTNFIPGYVAQQRFVSQYQPRIVTVSIGGNDIGFDDILQKCVAPHISRYLSDETCYNTYESRQELVNLIDRTLPRWTALYRQLQAESPGSIIYAIGYPSSVSDTGKCPLGVNLGKSELEFGEEFIHYLNGAIRQAAVSAGVSYTDISQALIGHRLCEADGSSVALNGLTAGNDFGAFGIGVLGRESYHPNALGHQLIEQSILHQTNNLSVPMSTTVTDNDSQSLLDAPKSGRAVNVLVPDDGMIQQILPAGSSVAVHIDGLRDGLRPNSSYDVRLDGPTGLILASLASDSSGNVSGNIIMPVGTTDGGHTIDVTGTNQAGEPVDVTRPVYIPGDSPTGAGRLDPQAQAGGSGIDSGPAMPKRPDALRIDKVSGNLPDRKVLGNLTGQSAESPGINVRLSGERPYYRPRATAAWPAYYLWASIFPFAAVAFCCRRRIIKCFGHYFGYPVNIWRKINYEKLRLWFTIVIMRKFGVVVFSLVLFASLLALAGSTSSNITLTHPKKLEKWLSQSGLYNGFVDTAIDQADKTAGDDQSGGVSLSDTAVKQAAESAFSPQLVRHNVNLFLDSNYAWLNGKTAKPDFKIDLTDAKTGFAERVGRYVTTYLSTLPACTPEQTAQIDLSTVDPLTLSCRPSGLDPATEGVMVTRQIESNGDFLSDPVITANTFNAKGQSQNTPYYQQYASAPKAYKLATKIPWIAGALVILSAAAVFFLASVKRKGIKIIGVVLAVSGVILVLMRLVSDQIFKSAERHIFNQASVGQLQKSLTVFFNHIEGELVKVDLWFGIGYLLLAGALLAALIITRQRGLRIPKPLQALTPSDDSAISTQAASPKNGKDTPAIKPISKPRRPKPPRLVQ